MTNYTNSLEPLYLIAKYHVKQLKNEEVKRDGIAYAAHFKGFLDSIYSFKEQLIKRYNSKNSKLYRISKKFEDKFTYQKGQFGKLQQIRNMGTHELLFDIKRDIEPKKDFEDITDTCPMVISKNPSFQKYSKEFDFFIEYNDNKEYIEPFCKDILTKVNSILLDFLSIFKND